MRCINTELISSDNAMSKNTILPLVTKFIAPFTLLFVLYIQVNGEVSPGGGFQAGAIFASLLIGLNIVKAFDVNKQHLITLSSIGIILYILPGLASLLMGQNFLNYNSLAILPSHGQQLGIFTVEIGIGLTVSSALYLIYKSLLSHS
jgi:multicomponent Na+:H+ antiporter subunit B